MVSSMTVEPGAPSSIVLVERLAPGALPPAECLRLPLSADQRTSSRGHRRSACGRDLVLQLPRGVALEPGEVLLSHDAIVAVRVEAAPEALLRVRSVDPLALLQAAYHLGNRHVAMELHADQLLLLQDSVLEDLLRQRGLSVERLQAPFQPEAGAYAGASAGHGHHHHHSH
jgi:urease accessory protein